jgi:cysteinyl-tRNA synthetase
MSKSLGNFFTIRDILKKFHPEALRLFLLSSHYRSPIDFSDQNLEEAEKVLTRYYEFFADADKILKEKKEPVGGLDPELFKEFKEAMDDDFNTAVALAHMGEQLRGLNKLRDNLKGAAGKLAIGAAALKKMGETLGLFLADPKAFLAGQQQKKIEELKLDTKLIETLIAERSAARAAKDWSKADDKKMALTSMGVILEDTPEGTLWKVK